MIELRTLRESELEAWYAHCHTVFADEAPGYFKRHYELDPDRDASLIFVAVEDGEIAATVRVFRRRVWLKGRLLPMGGIGEVSTKVAYRQRGLAASLLAMAIEAMTKQGVPISILFGDQPIYERAGYRFCPVKWTLASIEALEAGPVDMRGFVLSDLPLLMGMHDLYAGRVNGMIQRSCAYWHSWVLAQWQAPEVLLLDGSPAAYCSAVAKDGELSVLELCAAPQGERTLPAFVRAIAARSGCETVRFLSGLMPGVPGEDATIRREMMVRLNVPVKGIGDSDALSALMAEGAGIFLADAF